MSLAKFVNWYIARGIVPADVAWEVTLFCGKRAAYRSQNSGKSFVFNVIKIEIIQIFG